MWILVELLTITLKYFFSYDQVKNILEVSYYKGRLKLQKISIYDERELRTLWVSPVEQDTWVHHCVCWVSVAQFVHAVFCVVFCGIFLVFLSYFILGICNVCSSSIYVSHCPWQLSLVGIFGNPFIGSVQSRLVLPRNIMEPFKLIQTEYAYFE